MVGIIGTICGDAIGSPFEFRTDEKRKSKDFELITPESKITDDSVHTLAVAEWLMDTSRTKEELSHLILKYTQRYSTYGFGGMMYKRCIMEGKLEPYGSWGNGSAMRVSPVGWVTETAEECLRLAVLSASVSHNHPEGIKGAQATALAIFMNRNGYTKDDIKEEIESRFGYDLDTPIDEIRPGYSFDVSCQGSVPQAIRCWYESTDYEDCIRNAVSLGGDADTQAAIAGSICAANPDTEVPEWIVKGLFFDRFRRFEKELRETHIRFHLQYEVEKTS